LDFSTKTKYKPYMAHLRCSKHNSSTFTGFFKRNKKQALYGPFGMTALSATFCLRTFLQLIFYSFSGEGLVPEQTDETQAGTS